MARRQNGFSIVSILATLLIVGIIACIGWFVYSKQSRATKPVQAVNQSAQNPQHAETDPYSDWKTFKSTLVGASFKYPQNWHFETNAAGRPHTIENTLLITPKDSDGYSFTIGLLVGDTTSLNGTPYKVYGSKQVGNGYIIFFSSKTEDEPSGFTISKYDVSPGGANPDFVEKQYTKDETNPVIFMGQLSKRDVLTANTSRHSIDAYTSHQYWDEVVKVLESFSL